MLFTAIFKMKGEETTTIDRYLARRTQGADIGSETVESRFEGVTLVGEYWLQNSDPRLVIIFEADTNGAILELVSEWDDHFEITVVPAVNVKDLMSRS